MKWNKNLMIFIEGHKNLSEKKMESQIRSISILISYAVVYYILLCLRVSNFMSLIAMLC